MESPKSAPVDYYEDLSDYVSEPDELETYNNSQQEAEQQYLLAQLQEFHIIKEKTLEQISIGDQQVEAIMAGTSLPALEIPMSGANRASPSPTSTIASAQPNGANAPNYASPLPAGHQQDLNYLYSQIQELSAILKSNREKTATLSKAAEEIGRRAQVNGLRPEGEAEGSVQTDQARIRELEREIVKKDALVEAYKHEQRENTNLIAMYENAVGSMTEGIRNFCLGIEGRFLEQKRHYNDLLQQEKDEHLASRLDRDAWHAKTMRCCEIIRTAHRLRTDEWCEEYAVVAGLQGEARCYRRVLGMDPQKPEEEGGWPYLKDLPLNDTGPV